MTVYCIFSGYERHLVAVVTTEQLRDDIIAQSKALRPKAQIYSQTEILDRNPFEVMPHGGNDYPRNHTL